MSRVADAGERPAPVVVTRAVARSPLRAPGGYRPRVVAASAASLGLHLVTLAAMAVSLDRWQAVPPRASFAGQSQTWSVEAQWTPPPLAASTVTLRSVSEPVIVQPAEAQVADRSYRFAPSDASLVSERPEAAGEVAEVRREASANGVQKLAPKLERRQTVDESLADVVRDVELERRAQPVPSPPPASGLASVPALASLSETGAGTREAPRFFNNRPPAYPETARQRRWQGTVFLRISLDDAGNVVRVEVARSSGYALLDAEAVSAVRQWKAEPARRDGQPIATEELLPVRFELP